MPADTRTRTPRRSRARSAADMLLMIGWRVAVTIAVTFFAVAAVREPESAARLGLIALAGAVASAPVAAQAVQRRRRGERAARDHAMEQEESTLRLREDIHRVLLAHAAEIDRLSAAHAGAPRDQWRAQVRAYALSTVLPAMSYGMTAPERDRLVSEVEGAISAFLAPRIRPRMAPPADDVATLVDACAAAIAAARWESWVTPGHIVAARRGGVRLLFFCVDAAARIDKAMIDSAHARCEAAGVRFGAIVSTQTPSPAAVAYAKSRDTCLIRPAHMPKMLAWALNAGALKTTRSAA